MQSGVRQLKEGRRKTPAYSGVGECASTPACGNRCQQTMAQRGARQLEEGRRKMPAYGGVEEGASIHGERKMTADNGAQLKMDASLQRCKTGSGS